MKIELLNFKEWGYGGKGNQHFLLVSYVRYIRRPVGGGSRLRGAANPQKVWTRDSLLPQENSMGGGGYNWFFDRTTFIETRCSYLVYLNLFVVRGRRSIHFWRALFAVFLNQRHRLTVDVILAAVLLIEFLMVRLLFKKKTSVDKRRNTLIIENGSIHKMGYSKYQIESTSQFARVGDYISNLNHSGGEGRGRTYLLNIDSVQHMCTHTGWNQSSSSYTSNAKSPFIVVLASV